MKQLNKLDKTKKAYDAAIAEMEKFLKDKIDFNFCICYHEGDGHTVFHIDSENDNLATLDDCLSIIRKHKKLSLEQFNTITI